MLKIALLSTVAAITLSGAAHAQTITPAGLAITQTATGTVLTCSVAGFLDTCWAANQIQVTDNVSSTTAPKAGYALDVEMNVGASAAGNPAAISGIASLQTGNANVANLVGILSLADANANMGGTASAPAGAIFGENQNIVMNSGATNLLNATGMEVDIDTLAGSTARRSGISIVSAGSVLGSQFDGALSISAGPGFDWANGILFSNYNGAQPISAGGSLITTQGSSTVNFGINLDSYTFTTAAIATPGFMVGPSGNVQIANMPTGTSVAYVCLRSDNVLIKSTTPCL
jgi:hypothetical protein